MKLYDLSLPLSETLPTWPGDPNISMSLKNSMARGQSSNVTELKMGVHSGTHMDAPFHFEPEGRGIDQLPLETLIGPCRVFDLSHLKQAVDRPDLEALDLEGVTRVLFKTRNSQWWLESPLTFHTDFVYLSTEGASFLISKAIALVGIDYLSIEKFKNPDHPTHHVLLRNDVIIIEGLNLNDVPAGDYELIALPLKLQGADGAPTRVVLRTLTS